MLIIDEELEANYYDDSEEFYGTLENALAKDKFQEDENPTTTENTGFMTKKEILESIDTTKQNIKLYHRGREEFELQELEEDLEYLEALLTT